MKKVFLAAPLCAAALSCGIAHADPLSGSDDALILGGTGVPTPSEAYLEAADQLYLQPLGFDGTTTAFTTPETDNFGPSVTQGANDLANQIDTMYKAGDFSAAHPLTVFGYSQSAVVEGFAEQQLAADGIPSKDVHFVMVGDSASTQGGFLNTWGDTTTGKDILGLLGWTNLDDATTPSNLYPTDVYTIPGDGFANWGNLPEFTALTGIFTDHLAYLGLTPAEIDSATPVADGLTTYFDIPALTSTELWDALVSSATSGVGLSAATSAVAAALGL